MDNKKRAEMVRKQASLKKEEAKREIKDQIADYIQMIKKEMVHVKLFLKRSTKPNKKEYKQLLRANLTGVCALGFLGYIITFIHIPINNILFGVKR